MYVFWWILVSSINILLLDIFYETIYLNDISTATFSVGNILIAILVRNELILHLLQGKRILTLTQNMLQLNLTKFPCSWL